MIISQEEHPAESIFPLLYRPFGTTWANTPLTGIQFNKETYGSFSGCSSTTWRHRMERRYGATIKKCSELTDRFAMVQRRPFPSLKSMGFVGLSLVNEKLCISTKTGFKTIHEIPLVVPSSEADVSFL